jgi:transcriptional regulator with XRE-family HTH domain
MKSSKELLGGRIRELRKGLKLSQEQLSEKVDVDPRYISRIEQGKCFPSLETLESIARALNAEMRDVFDYGHLSDDLDCQGVITEMMGAVEDNRQRQLILRITKAVTRSVINDL